MLSSQFIDALIVVALVAFYGGISRELATTADFLDVRLGLGLSLGAYVATGVAGLLSITAVALATMHNYQAGRPVTEIAIVAVAYGTVLFVAFGLFFKLGTAIYGLLLRVGLGLS